MDSRTLRALALAVALLPALLAGGHWHASGEAGLFSAPVQATEALGAGDDCPICARSKLREELTVGGAPEGPVATTPGWVGPRRAEALLVPRPFTLPTSRAPPLSV